MASWVEEARREARESLERLGPDLARAAMVSGTTSMLSVLHQDEMGNDEGPSRPR